MAKTDAVDVLDKSCMSDTRNERSPTRRVYRSHNRAIRRLAPDVEVVVAEELRNSVSECSKCQIAHI